jgi:hypothetical protein
MKRSDVIYISLIYRELVSLTEIDDAMVGRAGMISAGPGAAVSPAFVRDQVHRRKQKLIAELAELGVENPAESDWHDRPF